MSDLLNEFAKSEDEFDVDLLSCGCRLPTPYASSNLDGDTLPLGEILKLRGTSVQEMADLVENLASEYKIDDSKLMGAVEKFTGQQKRL